MLDLLKSLGSLGTAGAIIAVLFYDVFYLQKRLMQIIENNTQAMAGLKEYCRNKNEK